MKIYDLIIIGGGPAGLSAAINAGRIGLDTLLLEKDIVGGQPAIATIIENYPGIQTIDGWKFTRIMEKQAQDANVEIVESAAVVSIEEQSKKLKNVEVHSGKIYHGKAVIVATGGNPEKYTMAGEEKYYKKGVHYCAECAGPAYKNRQVMVYGNGNRALEAANHLLMLAEKVILVIQGSAIHGDKLLKDKLINSNRYYLKLNYKVKAILGHEKVEKVELYSFNNDSDEMIEVDGIFIYTDLKPETEFIKAKKDRRGYLIVDFKLQTSILGVFAAGNVIRPEPQLITAAGEGALAAYSAASYLT